MSEKQINRAQLLEELEKLQSKVKTMEMSETKYKYLFEKSQAVNMLVGKDGNILAVNNWAAELFGYDSKDLIGRDPLEFVVPEQQAKAQEQLGLVLQGVSTSSFEVNVIGKGGIRTLLFAEGKGILYHKGETVGVLLSALDITEHKRAEAEATTLTIERERAGEELRESEEKYRMLVEKVQDGFFIIQDGLMIFVNEAFASMAGYTVDEVIGMDFRKLIAPEDLAMVAERYKKRQEGKPVPPAYEFRMIHKDGKTIVNVFMTVGIIKYRGKAATIGTSQNITERKKAEEAILASERNYREIFNGANEIIFVHHPETGAVLDANQTACDVFGYTTDEILNLAIGELSSGEPPYTYKEAGELIQKAVKEGPQLYEWIAKDKKGRLFWCEFNLKIAVIGGEERILAVGRDITDRKQVEEALQESENRYRTLVETLQEGLGIVDPEENIVFANPALCDIFGYSSKEIIGMSLRDFVPKEDFQKILRETSRRKKGISSRYEVIIKRKDGELRDIRISTAPWMNEKGEFQGTIGVLLDMTEQKRAAAAVRESEEKLQTILESANDLVIQLTPTGFVKYLSPNCERLTGYKPEELIGKHMKKTTPISEVSKSLKALKRALKGEVIRNFKINQIHKDGRIVPTETNITPVRKEGKIIAVQGIMRDISERKQAEKAIRESEERYRSIFASSADALLIFDFNGNIVEASPAACEMYGYSIEEFIRLSSKDIVHPDYYHLTKQFNRDVRIKGMFRAESVDIRKDGTAFDIEIRGTKFHYAGEERLLAIVRDISERKQAEEALRESEGRFRSIAENIPGAVYMYYIFPDGSRSEQFVGPGLEELIGKADKDESRGEIDRFFDRILPEELEALHRAGDIALENNKTLDYEYRARTNSGEYKWYRSIGRPILMEDGRIRWQGVLIDVDEHRRAEERIRLLSSGVEQSSEGVAVVDLEGNLLFMNKAFADSHGYTQEELMGKNLSIFHTPEQIPSVNAANRQIQETGSFIGEIWHVRRDGTVFPSLMHNSLLRDEAGNPIGMIGTLRDISEIKQAEKLQNSVYRITQAVESSERLDDLFRAVHKIIQDIMPAKNFFIALYDDRENLLSFPYFADEVDAPPLPRKPGKELTTYVLRTGESLLCTLDVFEEMVHSGEAELIGEPSPIWLGVPLKIENRTIGVMVIQHYINPTAYGIREQQMLEFVSTQVAKAIERKQAEEALKASEEFNRAIVVHAPVGVLYLDADGIIIYENPASARMMGVPEGVQSPVIGQRIQDIPNIRKAGGDKLINRVLSGETVFAEDFVYESLYEVKSILEVHASPRRNSAGEITSAVLMFVDKTEHVNLEVQFRQSQKMEAIGLLAGGVAHDFNNVLTAIIGHCELGLKSLIPEDPIYTRIQEIYKAADSAAALTRQLLAFSRKQALELKVIDLSSVISNMDKMLRRIIGENIDLRTILEPNLWKVKVDPGQIEQVIVNLAVNARDAMMSGGKLTIELANVELDEMYTKTHVGASPGPHVMIAISDTGIGMTEEVKEHIFDPFFTTKEIGRGTGLGLPTVYGIVKQSGGNIWVYSEPDKGTTLKIYLPKVVGKEEVAKHKAALKEFPRGSEAVLVVEDDDSVRELAVDILEMQGYKVFKAENGSEAYQLCQKMEKPVDLVVTDVVMPGMGGIEFCKILHKLWPEAKVLYMSGYTPDTIVRNEILERGKPYMQKPFMPLNFAQKVREVLDS